VEALVVASPDPASDVQRPDSKESAASSDNAPSKPAREVVLVRNGVPVLSLEDRSSDEDAFEILHVKRAPKPPADASKRTARKRSRDRSREATDRARTDAPERGSSALSCTICTSAMREPTSTTCGHLFCNSCIRQALALSKLCPVCRKRLTMRSIHRVYL